MKLVWIAALVAACKPHAPVPLDTPPTPWSTGSDVPDPRFEPGVTALGQSVAVVDGWDTPTELTTRVDLYDTTQGTWFPPLVDAPVARHDPQVAVIGTTLYLLGGLDAAETAHGDCYALDTGVGSATWQPIAPIPPGFERGAAAVITTAPRIYLVGGESSAGPVASMIFYDSIADAWTTVDTLPDLPVPLARAAGIRRVDGTFVIAGGGSANAYWLTPDQQTGSGAWADVTAMPTATAGCAYGAIADQLLCAGGSAGASALATMQGYASLDDSWTTYATMPAARAGAGGIVIANSLYVVGGSDTLAIDPTSTLFVFTLNDVTGTQ
ncbi:MAG TPA: hypothetical protein VGG74_31330 [Kofleriaceae bacterium]|jgi:N-acetylneuraminic acid mutarotase